MEKELGLKIRTRRKLLGLTQRELSEYAEISINTLTKIERGEGNPTLNVLVKILDILGLKLTADIITTPKS